MNYKFVEGSRMGGDAQAVGEALQAIREEKSKLVAPDVVDAAKSEISPLHRYFEWRDDVAAGQYRCEQARSLIRQVVIIPPPKDDVPQKPIRAFFNVVPDGEASYEPIKVVMADEVLRKQLLNTVYTDLDGIRRKLNSIQEYADLADDLGYVQGKIQRKLGKLDV